jgi:hypothetical protein
MVSDVLLLRQMHNPAPSPVTNGHTCYAYTAIGKLTMRTRLGIAVFVWLSLSVTGTAQKRSARCTTLVVEYTGEHISRSSLPVIITTSQEEGEWYRQHFEYGQHFGPDVAFELAYIQVVPQSVLDEMTGLPLVKPALKRARTIEEHLPGKPETGQNATFSAGVGHDYAPITVDKQPSMKILKGIEGIAARYPLMRERLRQIDHDLK